MWIPGPAAIGYEPHNQAEVQAFLTENQIRTEGSEIQCADGSVRFWMGFPPSVYKPKCDTL